MMTYSDVNKWDVEGDAETRKYVEGSIVQDYIEKYFDKNLNDPRTELRLNSTVEDVERLHVTITVMEVTKYHIDSN